MNELAYKRISSIRIKLASIICDQINKEYDVTCKEKLIYNLSKIGIGNVYNLIYDFAVKNPNSRYAIKAIANFDRKESIEFLQEKIQDTHTLNRELIVECLGNYKKKELVPFIKTFLADNDRQVRFQTVYSLFNIGGKEAALAMCDYISDPDEWISMTILRLLCRMRELDTIPILIEKYHSDKDLRRKALMISFLSRFQSITLLGAFDDALHARDARLRANAIEAIGELKLTEEELLQRITPFLHDPNNRIRANAILALAKITPEKVKAQIVEMCNSDDVQLRRSAAFILCMIPPNDFFKEAENLIVDENETVRKRMIQSLKNFPHEFISSNINKVLSDENKWIRKYAIDMVAAIPAFESTPIVNILKTERDAPNIESCLKFLISHPNENAMNSLRLHFKDKRLPVVKALLKALVALGGIEEVKKVAPRLEQHDPFVVQNITTTMLEDGDLETLEEFIKRFERVKKQPHVELLIPALEAIIDIIIKGDKMPAKLINAFSYEQSAPQTFQPSFAPPQQPVTMAPPQQSVQPILATPQQQTVQPGIIPPIQQPVQQVNLLTPQPPVKPINIEPPQQPAQLGADNDLNIDFSQFGGIDQPVQDIPVSTEQANQPDQFQPLSLSDDSGQPEQQLPSLDVNEMLSPLKGDNTQPTTNSTNLNFNLIMDSVNQTSSNSSDLLGLQNSSDGLLSDSPLPNLQGLDSLNIPNAPEISIKKKPEIPHYKAGLKAYNLGKYPKAIEEFNKSIANNESCPENINLYLGIMLNENKEYEAAIKHLAAFMKSNPTSAKANFLLGKCYRKTKDWQKVIDTYQLFIEGEIESTPKMKKRIHQDMGTACAILGKNEMAIRLLTNLFRLENDNAEIGYYLAMALYKMKKTSEALVIIEQCAKVAPQGKPIEKQIATLAQTIRSGVPLPN